MKFIKGHFSSVILMAAGFGIVGLISVEAYSDFTKAPPKLSVLSENHINTVGLDQSLQPTKERSRDMVKAMAGLSLGRQTVMPSLHVQYSRRLKNQSPLSVLFDVGYRAESRNYLSEGKRNFHELPLMVGLGADVALKEKWTLFGNILGGARSVFLRGFSVEQNRSDLFWDLQTQLGFGYSWASGLGLDKRGLGLTWSRYFGLNQDERTPAVDELLASFVFDI